MILHPFGYAALHGSGGPQSPAYQSPCAFAITEILQAVPDSSGDRTTRMATSSHVTRDLQRTNTQVLFYHHV